MTMPAQSSSPQSSSPSAWLEEEGRVVALFPGGGWVETTRGGMCSGCSARHGCGSALLSRFKRTPRLAIHTDAPLRLGDSVTVGVPSGRFLKAALTVYGLPLIVGVLAGGVAEQVTAAGHFSVPLLFVAGLLIGALISRFQLHRQRHFYRPRLLNVTNRA